MILIRFGKYLHNVLTDYRRLRRRPAPPNRSTKTDICKDDGGFRPSFVIRPAVLPSTRPITSHQGNGRCIGHVKPPRSREPCVGAHNEIEQFPNLPCPGSLLITVGVRTRKSVTVIAVFDRKYGSIKWRFYKMMATMPNKLYKGLTTRRSRSLTIYWQERSRITSMNVELFTKMKTSTSLKILDPSEITRGQ